MQFYTVSYSFSMQQAVTSAYYFLKDYNTHLNFNNVYFKHACENVTRLKFNKRRVVFRLKKKQVMKNLLLNITVFLPS